MNTSAAIADADLSEMGETGEKSAAGRSWNELERGVLS